MASKPGKPKFFPVISSIQKIRVYETKTNIQLIGSNDKETRFRILQIARSPELLIYEDPNEYDLKEIRKIISNIKYSKSISAYGIVGFVKFLENYYIILVTKRHKVGFIGNHIIYTIKDTTIYKITPDSSKNSSNPLESKYLKMFMNVDLSSNFYFSYSYDLTRTLQHNLSVPKFVGENVDVTVEEPLDWNNECEREDRMYAYRSTSRKKFVWNEFLLQPMQKKVLHKDWMLELIHGFINQSAISVFGLPIYVCLIARRSKNFAGTRFLKRGANCCGDVANEVETEQIVSDGQRLSSFVQLRGSVPAHWSQDISKMVPKPPISLDIPDPFAETAGKHFEKLLFHYGAPIIVLNLVKRKEKRKHESILTDEIMMNVEYLNQFLPANCKIRYTHFDMARKNRSDKNVMEALDAKGKNSIALTGIFYTDNNETCYQTGIIRTNCVDCLDRTNTAQFAMGRSALAFQLHKMGFLKADSRLEFDSDCVTMLESLYEIQGDTLALQYGGSQLVHRIKTYRKTSAWMSQGSEVVQNLSRYYSNTFSDQEKQQSINLFLGLYIPYENDNGEQLWDMTSDYNLHNPIENGTDKEKQLTMWYSDLIRKYLPQSTSNCTKIVKELIRIHSLDLEMIDLYSNYHLTYKVTSLEENIAYQISQFARNSMATYRTHFSPFEPTKRATQPTATKTPSSIESTSSSDEADSTSDEDDTHSSLKMSISDQRQSEKKSYFDDNLPRDCKSIYGFELEHPDKESMAKYKTYVNFQKKSHPIAEKSDKKLKPIVLESTEIYKDSSYEVQEPKVTESDRQKYENYCKLIINPEYDENCSSSDIIEKTYTEIAKYINVFIGIKWTLRGAEHLRQNKCFIIVANHQSCMDHLGLIDILYVMKRMSVVAKKELVYFFPGWYLTELVFIDRKNSKSKLVLDEAVEKFKKENVKLWIYPEGTRRNKGEIQSFKKGAFHSAIRHQIPIVPLVFSSYRHILDHEKKIFNEGEMIIQALPEISTAGLTLMDIDELIQQTRQKMIEIYDKLSVEIAENSNLN